MAEAARDPNREWLERIRRLEREVAILRRMPSGRGSIGIDLLKPAVKTGIPSDADYDTAPPIGTRVLDTTNNRLYVRMGPATWRFTALT